MIDYAVVFDKTATGYSSRVPDLPGCVAAGATLDEVRRLIGEAIELHIEGLWRHGGAVLELATRVA